MFLVQLQTVSHQDHQKWTLLTIFLKNFDHGYRTAKQLLSEYQFLPNTCYCLLLYLYHFCWIFSWINHASSCLYFFSISDRISSSSSGPCFFGQEDGKDIFVLPSFQKKSCPGNEELPWEMIGYYFLFSIKIHDEILQVHVTV